MRTIDNGEAIVFVDSRIKTLLFPPLPPSFFSNSHCLALLTVALCNF